MSLWHACGMYVIVYVHTTCIRCNIIMMLIQVVLMLQAPALLCCFFFSFQSCQYLTISQVTCIYAYLMGSCILIGEVHLHIL